MLRVNSGVLVVPPFECAWLTGEGYTLRSGAGCLSFEAKGETDVTVIFKSTPGAKRLQPLLRQGGATGGNALQVEQNYTVIFGSHRNSCLKIEKNGVTQCMVTGVACSRVSSKAFSKYWIDLVHGVLTVGHGELGQGVCHQWRDVQEIPGLQHIGLSCWDRHVSYRSIALQSCLDFTRLQQLQVACSGTRIVPSLFDATCAAIMSATTPTNVCRTLHMAELLLPTTQKLYRYCLDYIARHFETVVRHPDPDQHHRSVSPAAMCDLVGQNTFSVDEAGIFAAVRDWAASHIALCTAAAPDVAAVATQAAEGAELLHEHHEDGVCVSGGEGNILVSERSCVRHRAAPPVDSPRAPSSPSAPAGARPRLSEASSLTLPEAVAGTAAEAADVRRSGGDGDHLSWRMSSLPLADTRVAIDAPPRLPSTPSTPTRPQQQMHVVGAANPDFSGSRTVSSSCGDGTTITTTADTRLAEEEACRVLSLIRFPLLPIEQLSACLADSLLWRLSPVLELVHEALEVHRRETGAGWPSVAVAGQEGRLEGLLLSPSVVRRLVKPLPAAMDTAAVAAAAGLVGQDVGAPPAGSAGTSASVVSPVSGGASAAASDSCWSVRYQRRCLPFALELMYVCDGDSCGVLHYLGTSYGEQGWVNPMLAKRVDVRASSPTGRTTDPRAVAGRQFVRTNFAGPRYVNGVAISWWQVDLGEQHQLAITYYTLRHDGSQDFARSWVLQGSHDLSTWVDLKRHSNDTTIKVPGHYASWPVLGPAAAVPYRAFRLLLTAPNASPNPASRQNFCLSNMEFYGFLHKGPPGGANNGSVGTAVSGGSSVPLPVEVLGCERGGTISRAGVGGSGGGHIGGVGHEEGAVGGGSMCSLLPGVAALSASSA